MTKIKLYQKNISTLTKKYCNFVLYESSTNTHRFIENSTGKLECRIGIGKKKTITARKFRLLLRSIIQIAKNHHIEFLAIEFKKDFYPLLNTESEEWFASTVAENLLLSTYDFTLYKTKPKKTKIVKEIIISGLNSSSSKSGFMRGIKLGEAINTTRDIANTPAIDMTPELLCKATKKLLLGTKARVKILGEREIKKLGMNLLLAVGQGTKSETKLIVIEYMGAKLKTEKPIVFVGKGITYDTGGLNVKPTGFMHEMHLDMAGGAAVIGALQAITKLGLKRNVIGVIPAAENSISDDSIRAGDIVKSMSGKTVEILHTDAEGRLILADALTYVDKKYKPEVVLDVATLTGAALAALGHASDVAWELPLFDDYQEQLDSAFADIANIAPSFSRYGGTIEGGTFLSFFVGKWPWAHIDIAPRMTSVPQDKLSKGATGEPIRLLVKFVEKYKS